MRALLFSTMTCSMVASASLALVQLTACGGSTPSSPPTTPSSTPEPGAATGGDTSVPGANGQPTTTTEVSDAGAGKKLEPKAKEPGRSVQDIAAIVNAHRDEARACYDEGLKARPGIEGDLTVKWVIDPEGNVGDVTIDASRTQVLEQSVQTCVMNVIKKLHFAKSAKGFETRTSYPFNFHPAPPAKGSGR